MVPLMEGVLLERVRERYPDVRMRVHGRGMRLPLMRDREKRSKTRIAEAGMPLSDVLFREIWKMKSSGD